MSLLEVRGLQVAYGGIRAVRGIDLDVPEGEVRCLIGANGAGKTSTLKALSGLLTPAAGGIRYDGQDIVGIPPHRLVRQGLAMAPEGRGIFGRLTVLENLQMGAYSQTGSARIQSSMERVFELFPRLAERRRQTAGTLSGGEQQMLSLGRALMARPRLLLLDEPTMGLAPRMVSAVFDALRLIAGQGVTLLLVEQNARMALRLANYGYVLESGTVALQGTAKTLAEDPRVREAYLG